MNYLQHDILKRLVDAHERLSIALESMAATFKQVTKKMDNEQVVIKIDGYVGLKR